MIAIQTAFPHPLLREFVRFYAQREVHPFASGAKSVSEMLPARLEQTLEFQFGALFPVHPFELQAFQTPTQAIVGSYVRGCAQIELVPGVISFAAFFQPTGLSRLFGVPVCEIVNQGYDAALTSPLIKPLRERLGDCATFEQRVQILERFLLVLAAQAPRRDRMLAVAERIFSLRGVARISQVASQTGLGVRQLERQFHQSIGLAPKVFARVARFQSALDAKIAAPSRPWLEIAHDLRYHDQAHMIRDFQLLGGAAPNELLSQIGDARPAALLPESPAHSRQPMSLFY